jgi:hypothetical protein
MSEPKDPLVDRILAKHRRKAEPEIDKSYEADLLAEKEAELDSLLNSDPSPGPATETLSLVDRILARKKKAE